MVEADTRLFLGEARIARIPDDNRAFAYGEALFETMRAHRGELPWWPRHWARLADGAQRLAMPLPQLARVEAEAHALLAGDSAVIKLHLSRSGQRGYAPEAGALPVWVLSKHALPASAEALALIVADIRLSAQPALAGLKHGNRLEQILARSQAQAAGADEAVMCDASGRVIAASSANLFARIGGEWRTPSLEHCGVAGVMRGWLLDTIDARIAPITLDELHEASAVFLCNAVRGILPVRRLGEVAWPRIDPAIIALQAALAKAHPGFAHPREAA